MKNQWLVFCSVIVVLICKLPNAEIREFTVTDMHLFSRISELTLNNEKTHIVYTVTKWNKEKGFSTSHIQSRDSQEQYKITDVTDPIEEQKDSSPLFPSQGNTVFFLRTASGKTDVWFTVFPRREIPNEDKVTQYPISINTIALFGEYLLFSADVWIDCDTLECSAQKDAEVQKRGANTWQVYDQLMVRHWDKWYTQGKATHVFYQKLDLSKKPKAVGEPVDILKGKAINAPPIEMGSDQFTMSPNNKYIAFSGMPRDRNEAWNTKWNIYLFELGVSTEADMITNTEAYIGRCQSPMFSPNGEILSFLSMPRSGLESDQLYINLYDLETKMITLSEWQKDFKPFINYYSFKDDTHLILNTLDNGRTILYEFDTSDTSIKTAYKPITNDNNAYDQPLLTATLDLYYVSYSSFTSPTVVALLDLTERTKAKVTVVSDLNIEAMKNFDLLDAESFTFPGGNKELVQGWIMKPFDFQDTKKYPLAYLIHGGPEGAWEPSWSYRWNPQLWANRGYVVVMVNFHGSSGMGIDFQDKVRGDWGGLPYQDLMLGVDYVIEKYSFIDKDRMAAVGASYGGYMVNWIQGNSDQFRALVTHDGDFNAVTMFYATEEMWFPFAENCPINKQGCTPYESAESREYYEKFSPEMKANNWKTPHLIIHGAKDFRTPITEGISAFTALQLKGVPSRFLHFPDENHWVLKPENSIMWYNEVLGWLDKYVKL